MKWLCSVLFCFTITVSEVTEYVDGDTFDVIAPVWVSFNNQSITFPERVRVLDIDTPERRRANWVEYLAATAFTRTWLEKGPFTLYVCERDSFGRLLAKIYRGDSVLADELRKAGHAKNE